MMKIFLDFKYSVPCIILSILMLSGHSNLFSQENEIAGYVTDSSTNFRYNAGEEQTAGPKIPEGLKDFSGSSLYLLNQFGSFSFRNNGLKASVGTKKYNFFTSYLYQNYNGYLMHSNEYWNILNVGLKTTPSANTSLTILGSYFNGQVKLPGSLTKAEYEQDPFSADQRAVNRDEKNIPVNGNLDIKYEAKFGKSLNNEVEVSAYSAINNYQSATREYRIINRYGIGLDARYSNLSRFWNRTNTFSFGTQLLVQPERTEYYDNLGGQKGDLIEQLTSEKTSKAGVFIADTFEILRDKMFILLAGRYDHEVYRLAEETLPSRSDLRTFSAFTPKIALDFDLTSWLVLFGSFNLGYESPADIELDSPDPFYLFNPTLKPQTSTNFDAGLKINQDKKDSSRFLTEFHCEASFFRNFIDNEIIPYEVFGDVFFRNAAKSNRYGFEVESHLEIVKDLSFELSYIFSHFTYDFYKTISIETDSTGNIVQVNRDFSGNFDPGIPENYLRLSLAYKYPLSRKINIFAKISYIDLTGLWVDDSNNDKTNPYCLLDGLVHCDMKFGHFSLMVFAGVNNILNTGYVGFTNVNSADKRFYVAGAPRNYAGSLNIGYIF